MSLPDPLEGLPRPTAEPDELELTAARYGQLGRTFDDGAATLRTKVATGTAQDLWVGEAATNAAQAGAVLAVAYQGTGDAAAEAAAALYTCGDAWRSALADYDRARTVADDAIRDEQAHEAALPPGASAFGPPWTSPDRTRAQTLARTAIADVDTASKACAARLDAATAEITPRQPAAPPAAKPKPKHWWDKGIVGDVVHGTEHVLSDGASVVEEIVTHPGHLLQDAAGITLGVGLMVLGSGIEGGGLVLDASGIGLPAGVVVNLGGAAVIASGATIAGGFTVKAVGDARDSIMEARSNRGSGSGSGSGTAGGGSGASGASGDGSPTVADVLKTKNGSIRQARLPPGSPSWDQVNGMTMKEIETRAQAREPGYKTILKLLRDKRFDRGNSK